MNPTTALALVLAGVALRLLAPEPPAAANMHAWRFLGLALSLLVALAGLLRLIGVFTPWDVGVDELLFSSKLSPLPGELPNRMAPNTALCVFLTGIGLALLAVSSGRGAISTQLVALSVGSIALLALIGYVYSVLSLYVVGPHIPMALNTALAFSCLSLGMLLARPDQGLMGVVTSEWAGGALARTLLPAAVLIPTLTGMLALWGERQGLYDNRLRLAINVVASASALMALVWLTARRLNLLDCERGRAEAALQMHAAKLSAIIGTQRDALETELNSASLMTLIAERLMTLTRATGATVETADGDEMVCVAAAGSAVPHLGLRLNKPGSMTDTALATGEVQRCDDSETDPRVDRGACQKVGIRSLLVAPLRHGRTSVGAVKVFSPEPSFFQDSDLDSLRLMAGMLGSLLERALQFEERKRAEEALAKARDRLATVVAVQEEVAAAEPEPDRLMPLIAARAQALTRADGAIVELLEGDELLYVAGSGAAERHVGLRSNLTGSLAGFCVRSGQIQLSDDVYTNPYADREICRKMDLRSVIVAPLYHSGKPIGALMVTSSLPSYFTADDRDALQLVTGILGTLMDRALDHARRVRAEEELQRSRELLEVRVQERTAELARANAQLEQKNEELSLLSQQLWQTAKLATMGELAASIAHELNNPLGTVTLRVEGLLEDLPAESSQRRDLVVIDEELERMANLVANLLQFSRRSQQQVSTLNVREEMDATLDLLHFHLVKRHIDVVRDYPKELPKVQADRQQLRQVFVNLLTNASDAMPNGGTLTLRVTSNATVLIEIEDTGSGIPPSLIDKVKEPFFTTKGEGKGTGLGLAICQRIVQEHQGTFTLESREGQGTTVRIDLPKRNGSSPSQNGCRDDSAIDSL